jgi:molybdopterin-guanine dinucleotide biosynthesis protein A
MVDYVVARLPQTTEVLISANRTIDEYSQRGRVVQDSAASLQKQGPLVGIYAGLNACQTRWLLVCPGDMPILPIAWYEPLLHHAAEQTTTRVLHDGVRLQPLLCLVAKDNAAPLRQYIESGKYSVKGWHRLMGASVVYSGEDVSAFANVNSETELQNL